MADYDYNKIQPGSSDIDREAWPVMYDPYGQSGVTEVETKDTDTVALRGKGTKENNLRANVRIVDSPDNAIQITTQGLFVAKESSIIDVSGSQFIDVTGGRAKTVYLKVSEAEGNDLTDNEGLYVNVPVKSVEGSDTIDVTKSGGDISVSVIVSSEPDNALEVGSDGLFVQKNPIQDVGNTDTVALAVEGDVLKASAIPAGLDGKVKVETTTSEGVSLEGDGTENNPLAAVVDYSAFDGKAKVITSNSGNVELEGDGTTDSPLSASVDIPEDYIQGVRDTDSVALAVDGNNILSATAVPSAFDGKVRITVSNEGNVELSGDGTENSPLSASVEIPESYIEDVQSSDSITLSVDNAVLSASAIPSALDEKVKVKVIENWQAGAIEFYGDGTTENPIGAEIVDGSLDGSVGITTDSYNEYNVQFSGSGKDGDPLLGEVDLSDCMTTVETENTSTVSFQGTGWINNELKANVNVSTAHQDNILRVENDGLYVPPAATPDSFIEDVADTNSVALAVDGNKVLKASAIPSAFNGEVEIEYDNANSDVKFSGKGTNASPLTATVDFPIDLIEGTNPITASLDQQTDKVSVGLQVSAKQKNILEIVNDLGEEGLYAPDLNPLTDEGQIIYAGPSGVPETLDIGQEGQVLTVGPSSVPEWLTLPPSPIRDIDDTATVDLTVDEDGVLSASVKLSDATGNVLTAGDGLYAPELYLGAFPSSARPDDATTGQYILDTDLGYVIFRQDDAWVNAAGGIEEGTLVPPTGTPEYVQNPMTGTGDLIVGGSDGYPERLAPGTDGQLLSIVSGEPTWIDHNRHSVENYCIVSSTNKMELGDYANKMYTNLVIPGTSGEYNKLGFFHLSGIVGYVMLGVYDAVGNLVCTTPLTEPTIDTVGTVCWIDTTAPFRLEAGEVYQMAFYSTRHGYNNNINTFILEKDSSNLFSNYLAGEVNLTDSEFPATKPAVGFSDRVPWMGAKE